MANFCLTFILMAGYSHTRLSVKGGLNMTLLVAICDDEKGISAELESTLMQMFSEMNIPCEIDVYFTGEALCAKMASGMHYDLIFLDIEFAGMHGRAACKASDHPQNAINGVDVGKLIRETHQNNTTAIVYISWKMKYSMELFDIRPLHFLIKPLDYNKVAQVVKTYLNIAGRGTQSFTYKVGHSTYKVPMKDIVYLQSDKRKVTLHLADGSKEEFYATLPDVYDAQLKSLNFLFIHTSYVVNYDYIKAVKYKEVVLTTNETPLPISRPKRAEVREAYFAMMESRRV